MSNIYLTRKLNTLCLSAVLTTFSFATITPHYACAQVNVDNVAFGIRMEKLVEKIWKYAKKRNLDKLIDVAFETKEEIESFLNIRIDLESQINVVAKEVKNEGQEISKQEIKAIKKRLKKTEKKRHDHFWCMAAYLEECPSISFSEYETLYLASRDHGQEKEDEEEVDPILYLGVITSLCGLFLRYIPWGPCPVIGNELMKYGAALAVERCAERHYENRKKEKEKEKE